MSDTQNPYISLEDAKDHLSIDAGLTIHDNRIQQCIGAAIDWAEDYTCRSLGELLMLDSPTDSRASAISEDDVISAQFLASSDQWGSGFDWTIPVGEWSAKQYRCYWAAYFAQNPIALDHSQSLRRNVKQAILLKMEMMFDRNIQDYKNLEDAATNLIFPYRQGMGV